MPDRIEMPAPTAWPLVLALGISLVAAGVAMNPGYAVVGLVVVAFGMTGWFRQVTSAEGVIFEEVLPPEMRARPIQPAPIEVEQLRMGMPGHRLRLPEKMHPYSAGVRGGMFGGVAMAVVALLFGFVSQHGPWYPINLLSAMVLPGFEGPNDADTVARLEAFSLAGLVVGAGIHAATSVGLGLVYGVLLPTAPWPRLHWLHMLTAGVVAPLLWSGAIHGFMGVLNPVMNRFVEWRWFVASQIAYALVCGWVVMRSEMVYVDQPAAPRPPRPPEGSQP